MRTRAAGCLAFFLCVAGSAAAQTGKAAPEPDFAYGAYQAGFYSRAHSEALSRIQANDKDAAAMTLLGELYRQGLGVALSPQKAAEWYRLAYARGDANAGFALAMAHLRGEGVPKDEIRGFELLKEVAPRQPVAAYNLALLLLTSPEQKEREKAIPLLQQAAEAEIGEAQHALGVLKKTGRETEKDLPQAATLMRRAAANGFEAGEIEYAIMLFNGEGVPADEKAAADLFTRLAQRGNPIAQNRLARLYAAGRGRPRDLVEASAWHLAARQQGLRDESLDRIFDNLTAEDKARARALGLLRLPESLTTAPPRGQ